MMKRSLGLMLLFMILAGCVDAATTPKAIKEIGNPTPEDMLKNENADFFFWDGLVYSNALEIDWVLERENDLVEQLGEITKSADHAIQFKHGTANKLPVGTKIYKTGNGRLIYIAVVEGQEIPYLALIEG